MYVHVQVHFTIESFKISVNRPFMTALNINYYYNTMDILKLMYIFNHDGQIYPFCRLRCGTVRTMLFYRQLKIEAPKKFGPKNERIY